jgi:hypothetical protein
MKKFGRTTSVLAVVACAFAWGCGPAPSDPDGTGAMISRLATYPDQNNYTRHLVGMDTLPAPASLQDTLIEGGRRAFYLLQSGRHTEASAEVLRVRGMIERSGSPVPLEFQREIRNRLGLAAMWGAYEDACMARTAACSFPLDPSEYGRAFAPRLEAARLLFEARLNEDAGDEVARWLLNLAHMALGTYPDGVSTQWVIPPTDFYPASDFTRFEDRAAELGIDLVGHAGGIVFDDLDGDDDFDLLVSSSGLADSVHYFENRDGAFIDMTRQSGLFGMVGGLNLLQGDYDNDGDKDVFALRGAWTLDGQPNSLFRNEGGGRFADVTEAAGLFSVHPGQTAAWGDFDNDGWLDLVVGNEGEARGLEPRVHPLELYRNNRDGTFTEIARESGLWANRFVKAVAWGDYDNDDRVDLLVSAFDEPNALYHNDGPNVDGIWQFSEVTETAGIERPFSSLPAWWFDFNNDGWLDILILGYKVDMIEQMVGYRRVPEGADTPHLYINRGDGTFEDATPRVGLDRVVHTMGSNYGDLDNDGWLDFYLGTGTPDLDAIMPNVMFRNDRGRSLQDVSVAGGFSHMSKGHAVAFTDVDHDGDQDIYVVLGGAIEGDVARNVLWENPGHGNRWITLRLEGVQANRSAISSRIRVDVETPAGPRTIHALAGSGGSFGGSSLQQEIGLGDATRITAVEVRWPGSGRVETFEGVDMDRIYFLREGSGVLEPVDQPVVPLAIRRP